MLLVIFFGVTSPCCMQYFLNDVKGQGSLVVLVAHKSGSLTNLLTLHDGNGKADKVPVFCARMIVYTEEKHEQSST